MFVATRLATRAGYNTHHTIIYKGSYKRPPSSSRGAYFNQTQNENLGRQGQMETAPPRRSTKNASPHGELLPMNATLVAIAHPLILLMVHSTTQSRAPRAVR